MSDLGKDVEELKRWIEAHNARSSVVQSDQIVFDPRVRIKCQVPLCKNYGQSLMCPPYAPSLELMREVVARYRTALLVQRSLGIDLDKVRKLTKGKELNELVDNKEYDNLIRESLVSFTRLMGGLEREAAHQGHRFATSFTGGPCALCETCVGPEGRCCHPFQARPSMEAVGIDVIATAQNAGMPIRYPATDDPVWTGLLLLE